MFQAEIAAILRCTGCGAGLAVDETGLACPSCGLRYPAREGVLFMNAGGEQEQDPPPASLRSRALRRLYKGLSPPGVVYIPDRARVARFVASLGEGACVVDLGSGSKRRAAQAINVDIRPFPNVDIVYDGGPFPFRDGVLDGVISTAVLEHVPDEALFVSELYRVLKAGGRFLLTVPFMQGFHAAPCDYRRYTNEGLAALLSQFDLIESGLEGGPSSALAWVLREWIAAFGHRSTVHHALELVAGWLVQPIKYFDALLAHRRYAYKTAAGFYYVGAKAHAEPAARPVHG